MIRRLAGVKFDESSLFTGEVNDLFAGVGNEIIINNLRVGLMKNKKHREEQL